MAAQRVPLCEFPSTSKKHFVRDWVLIKSQFQWRFRVTCSFIFHLTTSTSPILDVQTYIEIQLKSPNWLFGQRKYEENANALKVVSCANVNGASQEEREHSSFDLTWLSTDDNIIQEDIFQRYLAMTPVNEANGWYGGTLLGDQDENSEIYKHYAELYQGPSMEPFEKEQYYANVLRTRRVENMDDAAVEAEMEAALKEYDQIGADLGIFTTCKSFAGDPS